MEVHLECDPADYEEPWRAKLAGRADQQMDTQTQRRLTDGDEEMDGWFASGQTEWLRDKQIFFFKSRYSQREIDMQAAAERPCLINPRQLSH